MITYKKGDLLKSKCDIICHQVNCKGVMGSGIAKQIRDMYPEVYEGYKWFLDNYGDKAFGEVWCVDTSDKRIVANMFTQYDYLPRSVNHTSYAMFRQACKQIKEHAKLAKIAKNKKDIIIGFPDHIGCGLAGGDWDIVKEIIKDEFGDLEWNVEIWNIN